MNILERSSSMRLRVRYHVSLGQWFSKGPSPDISYFYAQIAVGVASFPFYLLFRQIQDWAARLRGANSSPGVTGVGLKNSLLSSLSRRCS